MGRRLRITSIGLVVSLLMMTPLLLGSNDLREDELECEQAVSHLKKCCPATFDPTKVPCEYQSGCGSPLYPSLGVDDSKCIEDKSCDEILNSNLCNTVEELEPYVVEPDSGKPPVAPRVCR